MSETALTFVVLGAAVLLIVAAALVTRRRRTVTEQSAGASFSAAEFTTLLDNLSWYSHGAGEPPSGRHAARPDDGSAPGPGSRR